MVITSVSVLDDNDELTGIIDFENAKYGISIRYISTLLFR